MAFSIIPLLVLAFVLIGGLFAVILLLANPKTRAAGIVLMVGGGCVTLVLLLMAFTFTARVSNQHRFAEQQAMQARSLGEQQAMQARKFGEQQALQARDYAEQIRRQHGFPGQPPITIPSSDIVTRTPTEGQVIVVDPAQQPATPSAAGKSPAEATTEKPTDSKPAEAVPAEDNKPAETAPAEDKKPTEKPEDKKPEDKKAEDKPAEKSADETKPTDPPKEEPSKAEETKPTDETKPAEATTTAEAEKKSPVQDATEKPADPKPAEVKPKEMAKPAEATAETKPTAGADVQPSSPSRPAWVGSLPRQNGDAYLIPVSVGPYTSRLECDGQLPAAVRAAVDHYVDLYLGGNWSGQIDIPYDRWMPNFVRERFEEPIQSSFGPMVQLHALVAVDQRMQQEIKSAQHTALVSHRVFALSKLVGLVLAALAVAYLLLKWDVATHGRARRRIVAVLVAALLLVGVLAMA